MLHIPALWYFGTSVKYPPMIGQSQISCSDPHVLYSNYICEILLYNWQLVVITHELIHGVRVLSARGKNIVKQVYSGVNWHSVKGKKCSNCCWKSAELLLQTDHFSVWVFLLGLFCLQIFSPKKMDVCGISLWTHTAANGADTGQILISR